MSSNQVSFQIENCRSWSLIPQISGELVPAGFSAIRPSTMNVFSLYHLNSTWNFHENSLLQVGYRFAPPAKLWPEFLNLLSHGLNQCQSYVEHLEDLSLSYWLVSASLSSGEALPLTTMLFDPKSSSRTLFLSGGLWTLFLCFSSSFFPINHITHQSSVWDEYWSLWLWNDGTIGKFSMARAEKRPSVHLFIIGQKIRFFSKILHRFECRVSCQSIAMPFIVRWIDLKAAFSFKNEQKLLPTPVHLEENPLQEGEEIE